MSNATTKLVLTIITIIWLYTLARSILIMLCGKNIFKKARKGEKTAFYPIINLFTMLEVADIDTYWGILMFVPGINIIILTIMSIKLGKVFNVSGIYKLGLVIFPLMFYPLLSNSKFQYKVTDEEYFREMDSARNESINLMTEDDIKKINETEVDESYKDVDSIFKSDVQMMEKVAPYKAAKIDLLGLEKIKNSPIDDDVFKPIPRQESIESKEEIKNENQTQNNNSMFVE